MDDWNVVITECSSLAIYWEPLSAYLGLSYITIEKIKREYQQNLVGCWNEALKEWIKQNYNIQKHNLPSWRALLQAIVKVNKQQFKKLAAAHKGTK